MQSNPSCSGTVIVALVSYPQEERKDVAILFFNGVVKSFAPRKKQGAPSDLDLDYIMRESFLNVISGHRASQVNVI